MNYFLPYLMYFFLIILAVIFIAVFITFKMKKISFKAFVKGEAGNGAISSALLALSSIAIIAFLIFIVPNNANADFLQDGSWFNDAGVYVGLDYTIKPSPQCQINDPTDDRGTSNLGFKQNIWQDRTKTLRINAKYTHHSCFLGSDRNGYDGFGVEVEWKLYSRKR